MFQKHRKREAERARSPNPNASINVSGVGSISIPSSVSKVDIFNFVHNYIQRSENISNKENNTVHLRINLGLINEIFRC